MPTSTATSQALSLLASDRSTSSGNGPSVNEPSQYSNGDQSQGTNTWATTQSLQNPVTSAETSVPCCDSQTCHDSLQTWAPSLQNKFGDSIPRPTMMPDNHLPMTMGKNSEAVAKSLVPYHTNLPLDLWGQKGFEEPFEFYPFDPDAPIGQAYTTDEAVPIIDLRFSNHRQELESLNNEYDPNRRSASSMTVSTTGPLSDIPSYDDFSNNNSDPPGFSDYPALSNRTSLMSSTQLSPISSPRASVQSLTRPEQMRSQSRGRASSSPRPSARSAPYSLDGARGGARWSTGSYHNTHTRRQSPFSYGGHHDTTGAMQRASIQAPTNNLAQQPSLQPSVQIHSLSRPQMFGAAPFMPHAQNMMMPQQLGSHMPSQPMMPDANRLPQAPTLASHGLLRMLQSNAESYALRNHYADFADPPDLYASLHEEPLQPPPEDMKPSDPDMVPYEQELRFDGDLYTPKLVRGHGNKREGWCGLCKPGRWLVLKNSAYWYDKSFTHGISAATGAPFQEPLDKRRMDGNPDVWEGLCGSCNEWIALVSSKKKGTTWFRHAYKVSTTWSSAAKQTREQCANMISSAIHTPRFGMYLSDAEKHSCVPREAQPLSGPSLIRSV